MKRKTRRVLMALLYQAKQEKGSIRPGCQRRDPG